MTDDETSTGPNRSRPIRKTVTFSEAEWAIVERRRLMVGERDFAVFARQVLLDGEVRVQRTAFDPAPLRVELSRIGNNVNQIARHVNTEDVVTYDQMRATRQLLREVQQLIERAGGATVEE